MVEIDDSTDRWPSLLAASKWSSSMRKFVPIVWVTIIMILGLVLPATADGPSAEEDSEANNALVGELAVEQESMAEPEVAVEDHVSSGHASAKHDFHVNHFGGFIGASTHTKSEDTAFTLGLEYARQFSRRWAVAAYFELSSSDIERDVIALVGGVFYPIARVGLVIAPGVAQASKDVEHHGELEQEVEIEFLLRFGAAYGFPLNSQAAIGPAVFGDWGGNQWTVVYGLSMVVGF